MSDFNSTRIPIPAHSLVFGTQHHAPSVRQYCERNQSKMKCSWTPAQSCPVNSCLVCGSAGMFCCRKDPALCLRIVARSSVGRVSDHTRYTHFSYPRLSKHSEYTRRHGNATQCGQHSEAKVTVLFRDLGDLPPTLAMHLVCKCSYDYSRIQCLADLGHLCVDALGNAVAECWQGTDDCNTGPVRVGERISSTKRLNVFLLHPSDSVKKLSVPGVTSITSAEQSPRDGPMRFPIHLVRNPDHSSHANGCYFLTLLSATTLEAPSVQQTPHGENHKLSSTQCSQTSHGQEHNIYSFSPRTFFIRTTRSCTRALPPTVPNRAR